jgi:hypothetical protein
MNDIDEYLRANRDAFTREALTRRLVESGHDPADVDAAWARLDLAKDRARPRPTGSGGRPGTGTYQLIGATVLGYGYATLLGLAGISVSAVYGVPGGNHPGGHETAQLLALVYGLAMIAGLGYSAVRLYRAPSAREGGSAIGRAFAIAVVVLVGINGVCVAGVVATNALGAL